jgi:hypothetical protein
MQSGTKHNGWVFHASSIVTIHPAYYARLQRIQMASQVTPLEWNGSSKAAIPKRPGTLYKAMTQPLSKSTMDFCKKFINDVKR